MPQCREEKENKYCIFTIWPWPSTRTPSPGVMKFKILGRLFLSHHIYILSFSDLCLGVEKKTLKEINAFSLYDLYGLCPSTITLAPEFMKFIISLVIITLHLVCLNHALRRTLLKKYGTSIYNFLSPYPTNSTYQIWLRLAQQFLRWRF